MRKSASPTMTVVTSIAAQVRVAADPRRQERRIDRGSGRSTGSLVGGRFGRLARVHRASRQVVT